MSNFQLQNNTVKDTAININVIICTDVTLCIIFPPSYLVYTKILTQTLFCVKLIISSLKFYGRVLDSI